MKFIIVDDYTIRIDQIQFYRVIHKGLVEIKLIGYPPLVFEAETARELSAKLKALESQGVFKIL